MKISKLNIAIIAVTGVLIVTTGIVFGQEPILMLPFLISLCVLMMQSSANRYGYLVGGTNAVIYSIAYVILGWYGQAFSAAVISFPMQIITFFNWKKHSYGRNQVVFKTMTAKARIILAACCVGAWTGAYFILNAVGSNDILLDNTITLIGILVTVLVALRYVEYTYLSVVQVTVSLILNTKAAFADMKNITLVISAVFTLYCSVCAFINIHRLYKAQNTEASENDGR